MKKLLTLCLVTLFCCVTGAWAQGTGTSEDDPIVINNGDQFTVQTNVDTYFEFTAPSNGTLALKRDGWNPASFTIKEKGGNAESSGTIDYADNSVKFNNFTLEAGKAYIIRSVAQYDEMSESYTVVFTGEGGDLGDGSLENPYKVKANEEAQINVAPWSKAYVELTPEADGSLKITRTGGFINPATVTVQEKDGGSPVTGQFGGYADPSYTFDITLKAGVTYLITFDNTGIDPISNKYLFAVEEGGQEDNPNAFNVVSTDPSLDEPLAALKQGESIIVTLDKGVSYLDARIDGDKYGYISTVEATPVGEGTPVLDEEGNPVVFVDRADPSNTFELKTYTQWKVGTDVTDWIFYNDDTYTLTLTSYYDRNAWYDGTSLASAEVTFQGATKPITYSDIRLISVTPAPGTDDEAEMLNEENNTFTMEFDGKVNIEWVNIAQGQFGSIPLDYETEYTAEGHTIVTASVGEVTKNDYIYAIVVKATDAETGEELKDENPQVDGVGWFSGQYSFDIPCSTGRWYDTSLGVEDIDPVVGSYVTKLDKVYFTMNGAGDQDGFYIKTEAAETAALYNEAGEKVAYATLWQDDEKGAAEYQGQGVYMDGTTRYFYAELTDLDGTGTPVVITEPGKYTLKIEMGSIGDGDFDYNYPWMGPLGRTDRGNCNPEFNWTFNVVDHLVTVESVDPEPYSASGEYNDEVPAEITVNFSEEGVTVNDIIYQSGVIPTRTPITEYKMDGKTLTFELPGAATSQRSVTVTINANAANGQPISYGLTDEEIIEGLYGINLVYQMRKDILVPETVTPAEGESVEALEEITLKFGQNAYYTDYETTLELKDADGNTVTTATPEVGADDTEIVLLLNPVVTTPGEYTLTIPAEAIYDLDGINYNPELTLKFTVGSSVGINGIKVSADGTVKVYTIDGVYVGQGKAADMLGKLAKGVYIVNGTKVVVK